MPNASSTPTRIRYLVIATATLAAVLLYLERVCIAVAGDYIREDLRLSLSEMSVAYGMFFWAYALGQVPSGWLTDRFGPRRMMTVYLVAWSVFGVGIALAHSFTMLLVARFALGLSQAGAYPTVTVLIKQWVPIAARGWASSVVAFGGRFGGAGANLLTALLIVAFVPLTTPATFGPDDVLDAKLFAEQLADQKPPEVQPLREPLRRQLTDQSKSPTEVTTALNTLIVQAEVFNAVDTTLLGLSRDGRSIEAESVGERTPAASARLNRLLIERAFPGSLRQLHGAGWRPALFVYGAGGVLVGLIFWWLVRDTPAVHPLCNAAEVQLVADHQPAVVARPGDHALPWRALITSPNMCWNSATQFFINVGWAFVITLLPTYLADVYKIPIELRGVMTTVPLFVACVGMLIGGWLTDRLVRSLGLRWGRAIPAGVIKIFGVVALLACPSLDTAWQIIIALSVMMAVTDLGTPAIWAFAQDVGGRHVGAVVGWANMWGNIGAGLSPVAAAWAQKHYGWDAVFYLGAATFAAAMITGTLINATEPLLPRTESHAP